MARQEKTSVAAQALILKLPHPYLTSYEVTTSTDGDQQVSHQILPSNSSPSRQGLPPPTLLHNESISFSDIAFLANNVLPASGDNSSWARARKGPYVTISWTAESPTVPQMWLIAYALVSLHPLTEHLRVIFSGKGSENVAKDLYATGLFHPHPKASTASAPHDGHLLLRGTFWQGAASPFGPRPVWAPQLDASGKPSTKIYPAFPLQNAPSTQFPALPRHTSHPVREPKPEPGSIIYSRWIPHLKEHFTMIALDYTNPDHLNLFHNWQNDPRVAAGWNETGTVDEHREYLRKLHEDPHVLTMFAAFDDILFAYFEVYWAMVSRTDLLFCFTFHTDDHCRRITWALTTNRHHTTAAGILWSATLGSEARTVYQRGGLA
jgi:N5-hydroxy-L-ornithine N5-transacylase